MLQIFVYIYVVLFQARPEIILPPILESIATLDIFGDGVETSGGACVANLCDLLESAHWAAFGIQRAETKEYDVLNILFVEFDLSFLFCLPLNLLSTTLFKLALVHACEIFVPFFLLLFDHLLISRGAVNYNGSFYYGLLNHQI